MRTLELHAAVKQVQRSAGRSSVASAAYRSGERIKDERTGIIHDYKAKGGVELARIYTPDTAPQWAQDRAKLWNACEAKENRKNSCTARELEIAFPYEFNIMQRREAGGAIARELMRRYGCAVDIAYHNPSPEGDHRNFHAHILFTTRSFDPMTKDGWSKKKYREFSNDKIDVAGEKTTCGIYEVKALRKFVAREMNRIAEREKMQIITEYKSYETRGIEKIPTKKQGKEVTAMERKGEQTRRAELNRRIKARNEHHFKIIMDIQVQAHQQRLNNIDSKQTSKGGRGLFASILSLFTGGKKSQSAEREGLLSSIERKQDIIKAPKLEQERQINKTSNSNVGARDTINHRFKDSQPHSTIEDHKGLSRYNVKTILEQQDERMERYKKMVDKQRSFNDKSQHKTYDRGREIGD